MLTKVLFVDDEQSLLNTIQRRLAGDFEIVTAISGPEALARLAADPSFPVIVTDMRMPKMTGIQFIKQAREVAPDTIFIMLTGNQDQATASQAVNDGHVFRFINKPCESDKLKIAINDGIRQYHLVTAEKELLQKTFLGAVQVMMDFLELAQPDVFSQSSKMDLVLSTVQHALGASENWQLRLASRLSLLGFALLPTEEREAFERGNPSDMQLQRVLLKAVKTTAKLIDRIPRLEGVSTIVTYQALVTGNYKKFPKTEAESLENSAFMLRIAMHFTHMLRWGMNGKSASDQLRIAFPTIPFEVLTALTALDVSPDELGRNDISLDEVQEGMVLFEDIPLPSGGIMFRQGTRLSKAMIEKIRLSLGENNSTNTIAVAVPISKNNR